MQGMGENAGRLDCDPNGNEQIVAKSNRLAIKSIFRKARKFEI